MSQSKETIELLDFIFSTSDAVRDSLKDDGKITLRDVPRFFGPLWLAPSAFAGIEKVPRELSELDASGRAELMAFAKKRFELPDDELEVLIEQTLEIGWEFAVHLMALARYRKPKA